MAASNTIDCIREFFGDELRGVLVGERATHRGEEMTTYTLIFASGRGLTFAANPGGYLVWWREQDDDLRRALDCKADELRATGQTLAEVLELAGASA